MDETLIPISKRWCRIVVRTASIAVWFVRIAIVNWWCEVAFTSPCGVKAVFVFTLKSARRRTFCFGLKAAEDVSDELLGYAARAAGVG